MLCGIGAEEFWELSLSDICDTITAFQGRQKYRMQERASMDYAFAGLINMAICNPKRMPKTVAKAYPWLFERESQNLDWETIKSNMAAYKKAHNAKFRKAGDMIDH